MKLFFAIFAILAGCSISNAAEVLDYSVNCDGYREMAWPAPAMNANEEDKYFKLFTWRDGIPLWNYGGDVGLQPNLFFISKIGLLFVTRYCGDHSPEALAKAVTIREWLASELVPPSLPTSTADIFRFQSHRPNPPYSSKPGWGGAFAQATGLQILLRITPRGDGTDAEKIIKGVAAFLQPASNGGLHTRYGDDSVQWEEVAALEPSTIINGHIFATWHVGQVIKLLPPSDMKSELVALNEQAKHRTQELAKIAFVPPGKVLYDLRLLPNGKHNYRWKGEYPVGIMKIGYRLLIGEGYAMQPYLEQLDHLDERPKP